VARLYANENFPLPVVEGLRQFGHDVITIPETGKAEQRTSDEDVLQFAMAEDRAVLTLNRQHFIRLHQEQPGPDFAGPGGPYSRGPQNDCRPAGSAHSCQSPLDEVAG